MQNPWKTVAPRTGQEAGTTTEALGTNVAEGPGTLAATGPRPLPVLRGTDDDLRAMKRALANAPLGPKAVLALTGAILSLESDLHESERPTAPRPHRWT